MTLAPPAAPARAIGQRATPSLRIGLALSVISAAALAYEILLTRLYSIIQWHHFAYMMISIALLGYGAAGTLVTVWRKSCLARFEQVFVVSASLFSVCAGGAFLIAQSLPFNALEFLWDWRQPLWLALTYVLLFVPFCCAALCVCLTFTRHAAQAGRVYGFDILGGAAGCLVVIALLFVCTPSMALALVAAAGLLAAALLVTDGGARALPAGLLSAAVLLVWALSGPWGALRMSPFKELSQMREVMGTRVLASRSSPLGSVTVLESPAVPLRYAPGLSFNAPREPPPQLAMFIDGEGMSAIQAHTDERAALAYLDYQSSAAGYQLVTRPRVLILGAGSGSEVLQAGYHDAASVDAVELNPDVIQLVQDTLGDYSGRPYSAPHVRLHIGEARGFVAATDAEFDLIQIALLDAFGASSAGLYALSESYLYTVEALQAYLRRLAPGGVLAITRWVTLPPRDTLKLFGMAALALERNGVRDAAASMALVRSWRTATLLVKRGALSDADIARLQQFARSRAFDLDWYAGMAAVEANRYNRLDQSWFYDGARALLGAERADFIARYKFNLAPASDDRPFFFHYFRWRTLAELLRLKNAGGLPLLDWGYPLLVATLVQALAASAVFVLAPLWCLRRRTGAAARALPWSHTAAYFALLGQAFMFVEMAFIQKFQLFLHHPLYAVAVVLFAFLVAAGCGSRYAERWSARGAARPVRRAAAAIALLSLLYMVFLPALLPACAAWRDSVRIVLSVALIFPLGFAMGMPFPLGMVALGARCEALVPWAWGVNACSAVVSAVLATLLAIHFGFNAVLLTAVASYGVAAVWLVPGRIQGIDAAAGSSSAGAGGPRA